MKYAAIILLILLTTSCGLINRIVKPSHDADLVEEVIVKNTGVNWLTMNQALELQKTKPKKIFIDFNTKWCGPCKLLDKKTFANKDVAKYINEHYYAVKFDSEGKEAVNFDGKVFGNPNYIQTRGRGNAHEFSRFMQVSAYPTMVFLDENAKYITPIKGYLTPTQIEPFLKVFATGDYQNIQSQDEWRTWMDEFKNEFKN